MLPSTCIYVTSTITCGIFPSHSSFGMTKNSCASLPRLSTTKWMWKKTNTFLLDKERNRRTSSTHYYRRLPLACHVSNIFDQTMVPISERNLRLSLSPLPLNHRANESTRRVHCFFPLYMRRTSCDIL